ncbi:mucin-13 isoform X3 [Eublepharis macularius]|uniref:Mucin-13 isoform X3 n=1 Tax=Eublepharis macularius TaxID=481883 RepID=A0AA97IXB5_EUBMA|nr:mucin-13 isoform X3 [Eublepharis macularius]
MKGCVLLAVLLFAFCTVKATTITMISTATSVQPSSSTKTLSTASSATTTTTTSTATSEQPSSSTKTLSPASSATTTTTTSTATSEQPSSSTKTLSPASSATITTTTSTATSEQPSSSTKTLSPASSATTTTTTSTATSEQPSSSTKTLSPASSDNTSTNGYSTQSTSPTTLNNSIDSDTTTANESFPESTSSTIIPTSSTTVTNPITSVPLPCEEKTCPYDAVCINLMDQQYTCRCPFGFYYTNTSGCQKGKIFPGDLSLKNLPFNNYFENVNSAEYMQLYENVTQFFQTVFNNESTFEQTIISSVKSSSSTLKRLRAAERASFTVVSLINMFDSSTSLTSTEINNRIQKALNEGGSSFTSVRPCDTPEIKCDKQTTECAEKDDGSIPACECKPGLAKKNDQEDTSCLLCNQICSQENNKQCIMKDGGIPECQCMPNFSDKDGQCQKCDFGYSGENCKDNYMAIIVGVSVACGIVIVVLAGVLIYRSLRAKKEPKPERRSLLSNDYSATERDYKSKSATKIAPTKKIFPRIQMENSAGQGGQARSNEEGSVANMAYLPEQDYDDADPSSFEMTTRSKF